MFIELLREDSLGVRCLSSKFKRADHRQLELGTRNKLNLSREPGVDRGEWNIEYRTTAELSQGSGKAEPNKANAPKFLLSRCSPKPLPFGQRRPFNSHD